MMKHLIRFVLGLLFIVFTPVALAVDGVPMYVTVPVNPIYEDTDPPEIGPAFDAQTKKTLELAQDLGVTGVRFVVWWDDIYPNKPDADGVPVADSDAVQAYGKFIVTAMGDPYNFKAIVVLYGWPEWVSEEYSYWTRPVDNQNNFWKSFSAYVKQVVNLVKVSMYSLPDTQWPDYQIWNNANDRRDPIQGSDDPLIIYNAGWDIKESNGLHPQGAPLNKRIVNINADVMRWEHTMSSWISEKIDAQSWNHSGDKNTVGQYFDVIAVNNDPSLMNLSLWTDWGPVKTLLKNVNKPDDKSDSWNGKGAMVLGTSHSTWNVFVSNEAEQSLWIDMTFPALRRAMQKTMSHEGSYRDSKKYAMDIPISAVVYNDLIDEQGRTFWPEISGHLGVVKQPNLTKKLGYFSLKKQITKMQEEQRWQKGD